MHGVLLANALENQLLVCDGSVKWLFAVGKREKHSTRWESNPQLYASLLTRRVLYHCATTATTSIRQLIYLFKPFIAGFIQRISCQDGQRSGRKTLKVKKISAKVLLSLAKKVLNCNIWEFPFPVVLNSILFPMRHNFNDSRGSWIFLSAKSFAPRFIVDRFRGYSKVMFD